MLRKGDRMSMVSVIIPAYNQGHYLGEAVQSVLDQTYQDFEVIIVDDGSADNTREVAESFFDPRICYIYQDNRGLSAARNAGIRNATGSFITFLDSDDLFLPESLTLLVTVLESEPEIGFVAGQTILFDDSGHRLGTIASPTKPLDDSSQLLLGNPLAVGSMLLRRSWLDKVEPFDENLRAYEDWDMWLRLAKAGCLMKWIEQPVFLYRVHGAQMTREGGRLRTATLAVLDKIYSDPEELPESWRVIRDRVYSHAYLRATAQAYRAGAFARAQADLTDAVRLNPDLCADGARLLAKHVSAWADDPRTGDRLTYLERVHANLPAELTLLRRRRRQDLARAAMRLAFESYHRGDLATTRSVILRAFCYQPSWLRNRGALSIFVRSCFHSLK